MGKSWQTWMGKVLEWMKKGLGAATVLARFAGFQFFVMDWIVLELSGGVYGIGMSTLWGYWEITKRRILH